MRAARESAPGGGCRLQLTDDPCHDIFDVAFDLVIPESQDCEARCREVLIADGIARIALVMRPIGFDDEPTREIGEVEDIAVDGGLTPEVTALPIELL